jgi:hypothetical protein
LHSGFRFPRGFLLQAEFFKPLHRLTLHLGSQLISWLLVRRISRRSNQRQYCGLAEGFAGLKSVQPVKQNVPVLILVGADRYWSLLTRIENALSDPFHHLGIKGLSPLYRDVNSVDCDLFWFAHGDHTKQDTRNRSILTANERRFKATKNEDCQTGRLAFIAPVPRLVPS